MRAAARAGRPSRAGRGATTPTAGPGDGGTTGPRVAIAHDWLVRFAGSERVVVEMLAEFPGSRLLTTLHAPAALPPELAAAEPSLLQRIPGATGHHEWLLPLMPLAWAARRPVRDVDLVISSSHSCAKAVRIAPGIPHLSYCHTPMRYAWDFASEQSRFPRATRPPARQLMRGFRRWDRRTAAGVTHFLANSRAVAGRIERSYGRPAEVLHPPVDTGFFTPGGPRGDFFLYVGRLVAYKRPDLVVDAFRELPYPLVVVGDGHLAPDLARRAGPRVTFERDVTPERLRDLYRRARALVFPGEEDFGITMAEAQACGTPVIALGAGGALDIVQDGRTGLLLDAPEAGRLVRAVRDLAGGPPMDPEAIRRSAERFSVADFRRGLRDAAERLLPPAPARRATPVATHGHRQASR